VLEIAEKKFGRPPVAYCWLSFGSEGRKEQIFKTDQENAILYADPATPEQEGSARKYFTSFTLFVRDSLAKCGFPLSPADYMASNPKWCQPLSAWKNIFAAWMLNTTFDTIRQSLIFFDFRPLHGNDSLAGELRAFIIEHLKGRNLFLDRMAMAIMKNRPPLGFFRTFIVERDGEHSNELNLKLHGIAPLVDMVRLMALEVGVLETSTLERIEAMRGKHPALDAMRDDIVQAFDFIVMLRTLHMVKQMEHSSSPDDFINPGNLTTLEKSMLKDSFQVIARLQAALLSASVPVLSASGSSR